MKRKRHPILFKSLLAVAVLFGGLLADSNLRLVTTVYELAYPNLPAAFDNFRIVQLSDIHGAVYGEGNVRLLRAVEAAKPDLIALTGDLADDGTDLADTDTLLEGLSAIAPVYYVSGNHEWSDQLLAPLQTLLKRHGARYLRNASVLLTRGADAIVLAGVEDPNGWADQPTPAEVVAALPADGEAPFRLLLGHRNYWVKEYPKLPVDLILCGHAHGGVVRLPLLGGVLDHHGKLFPDYTDGAFASGRYRMVVSRGLGNSGGALRFCNNPELVVVVLRCAAPVNTASKNACQAAGSPV